MLGICVDLIKVAIFIPYLISFFPFFFIVTEFGVEEIRFMVSLVSIKREDCQIRLFGSHSIPTGWTGQAGPGKQQLVTYMPFGLRSTSLDTSAYPLWSTSLRWLGEA